jgi:hypothetical protein
MLADLHKTVHAQRVAVVIAASAIPRRSVMIKPLFKQAMGQLLTQVMPRMAKKIAVVDAIVAVAVAIEVNAPSVMTTLLPKR